MLVGGFQKIFAGFKRIMVVEMNDQGPYGCGQLATILRARYCDPKIPRSALTSVRVSG